MKNKVDIFYFFKRMTTVVARIILGLIVLSFGFGAFYWYNNRLFLWEAKLLWSQQPFSEEKFKYGSTEERAGMVVDLIQSRRLLGADPMQLPILLGEETGDYYHSDSNSTYRLTDKGGADWMLTFVSDGEGKIVRIFIRKSCCSVSRRMFDFILLKIVDPIVMPTLLRSIKRNGEQ